MSWQASRWAREQQAGSPTAKLVLLVIAEQADADGYCFIGHAAIAERAEVSRRAVVKQMQMLAAAGLIDRTRRADERGHRTSDHLRLTMNAESLGERDAPRDPSLSEPDAPRKASKVNVSARLGEPRSQEKVREEKEKDRAKAKLPLPEAFPTEEAIERERAYLLREGWNLSANVEAEKFSFYHREKDSRFKDWPGAFHNWIIKATGFAPASARLQPTVAEHIEQPSSDLTWRPRVAAFADPKNRYWNTTDWGPKPDRSDCRAPTAILAEHGFISGVAPFVRGGAA